MLEERQANSKSSYIFTDEAGIGPLSIYTLESQHSRVRKAQKLYQCVLHSFRHTLGTRLGEAGADAFTIMRIMGHSTVTVSQKYVHPTPEALERAFERLETLNQRATANLLKDGQKLLELPRAPVFLTVEDDTVRVSAN
jgi:site-specific recombinase XerD